MSETATAPPAPPAHGHGLTTGMRMDWAEFERRWDGLPDVRRAELIDGVVRMPSPVSASHAAPDSTLATWIGTYRAYTPGTLSLNNPTVRLDARNAPQPDGVLQIDRRPPAERALIQPNVYAAPPIEWVVEVGLASAAFDAGVKRELYQRFAVREYLMWRVAEGAVEWLALRTSGYEPLTTDEAGVLRSEVFPGLWLDVPALLRGDAAAVLRTLALGLAAAEHVAFLERLGAEQGA